jgi:predicted nuclease of predicted toxin-antitoxin system
VRFLADESCDFSIVRALRGAGHDVVAVAELSGGVPDREVIELARTDGRVLLTEDKDFGQLVFAALAGSTGVILVRYPAAVRDGLPTSVVKLAERLGASLESAFVTMTPGRIRLSRLPDAKA